jgi:hypothetical protein
MGNEQLEQFSRRLDSALFQTEVEAALLVASRLPLSATLALTAEAKMANQAGSGTDVVGRG